MLDAKYKGYTDWSKVQGDDLYQVITYMHILNLKRGGFIVPKETANLTPKTLNGVGGEMHIYGMTVNHNTTKFLEYAKAMKHEETAFFNQCNINTIIL